jgi:predicted MFS family arabinose efflux permease
MVRGERGRATMILIALRIVYAYSWFDIGPGLPGISATFGTPTQDWGLLLAAFFGGAGVTQIPAGLLARRYGTRNISLVGAAILGIAGIASAFSPSFWVLLALRAGTGAGAGLFFSPAIALVSSLHPEGARGIPVGTFSSAYSAGAGLGVFVSAIIIPSFGWRGALALGGILMLALVIMAFVEIPKWAGAAPKPDAARKSGIPRALTSIGVWGIGLSFIGLEGASLSSGQFFVPYAESIHGWGPALAGAIGALFVFPSVFGGPVGGLLTERYNNRRTQFVVLTAIPAALLILVPFAGLVETAIIALTFSFGFGMTYAIMYVIPPYLPDLTDEDTSLAIGLLNGIQLVGGACIALVIGDIVAVYGYTAAWEALGLLMAATLVFIPLVPRTRQGRISAA